MRGVWRLLGAWTRRLPIGLFAIGLLGLALASGAMAQSSVGRAANTATGQSLRDAVEQQQSEFLGTYGVGGGAGAGIGAGASPTGRLRSSSHDALKVEPQFSPDTENFAWRTKEASVFGTGVYALPGTVLGGQMKVSIFGGHNWLSLDMKNGGGNFLEVGKGQQGKATNESFLVGGSALWSQQNTYVLATMVGMWGETKLGDAIDFCDDPTPGSCLMRHYAFDTSGFIGSLTAGNVFALSKSPSGPMLDIRGAVGYTQNTGDNFFNFEGDEQKYKFSTWTVTGSATLFANVALQNSALLRPYIQGYVRQEVAYNNKAFTQKVGDPVIMVHWDQPHTYGGVDVGTTYTLGKMTLGAAAYYDMSADDRTFGGRLGASWKLN
jgi:hypothetical protein